jgi:small subunit ribosomal protein S21
MITVQVFDGNLDAALKKLKKSCLATGLFSEARRHEQYEKPSVRRRLKHVRAMKRERKRVLDGQRRYAAMLALRGKTIDDV